MANGNGQPLLVSVLDLLLTRANKLVVLCLVTFFIGPTVLAGYLVWRTVSHEDEMLTRSMALLIEHAAITRETANTQDLNSTRTLAYQRAMIRLSAETCKQQANTRSAASLCDEIARQWDGQ